MKIVWTNQSTSLCNQLTNLQAVFETCRDAISEADIVLAILDGADADSGTAWEMGYAYALEKKVLGIRTDFRETGDAGSLNCMLQYSADNILKLNCLTSSKDEIFSKILDFLH